MSSAEIEEEHPVAAPPTAPAPSAGPPGRSLLGEVRERLRIHNISVVAAGIAFWGLLAIPALLAATLSTYGLIADPDEVESQIEGNLSALPEEAQTIITEQLQDVAGASGSGLLLGVGFSIVLALWTVSGAVAKLMATLNTIFGLRETRRFVSLRGTAVLLTLGAILFVVVAAFLLAVVPPLLGEIGLGGPTPWLLNVGRVPALLVVMVVSLSLLYRLGPNHTSPLRLWTPGAVTATAVWLGGSFLFTVYTSTFSSYNKTYGALGGVVILLLWLYLTAYSVLLGAEIDAARDQPDLAEGSPPERAGD